MISLPVRVKKMFKSSRRNRHASHCFALDASLRCVWSGVNCVFQNHQPPCRVCGYLPCPACIRRGKENRHLLRHLILSHALWSDGWQRRVTLNGPCVNGSLIYVQICVGEWHVSSHCIFPGGVQQIPNRGLSDHRINPSCG